MLTEEEVQELFKKAIENRGNCQYEKFADIIEFELEYKYRDGYVTALAEVLEVEEE